MKPDTALRLARYFGNQRKRQGAKATLLRIDAQPYGIHDTRRQRMGRGVGEGEVFEPLISGMRMGEGNNGLENPFPPIGERTFLSVLG